MGALSVENFLGVKRVELAFEAVNFVAGDNWSGKSSLQQALRLALTGEVERVAKQSDYGMLVREGAKQAEISVTLDGGQVLSAVVWGGKSGQREKTRVPICNDRALFPLLNQHAFAAMDPKQRRALLFVVANVSTDPDEIARRLIEAGASAEKVEDIKPMLRAGLDGANDHIRAVLSDLRETWRSVTGELYGDKKGADWKCDITSETFDALRNQAAALEERRKSLALAKSQEADQSIVVSNLEAVATAPVAEQCAKCQRVVSVVDTEEIEETRSQLARQRDALEMLRRATRNRERDLAEAQAAADRLQTFQEGAERKTETAAACHKSIQAWKVLQDLLALDGLPTQLAGVALQQINQRLTKTAARTTWPVVQVRDDMEITVGNRLHGLCSEAERWIADAAITEALSWVSGHKLLVLDRMDVLSPYRRADLVDWLFEISQEGVQSIVFGTLKAAPKFDGARSYWLEAGEVAKGLAS